MNATVGYLRQPTGDTVLASGIDRILVEDMVPRKPITVLAVILRPTIRLETLSP